jgi:hypothetical protein
MTRSLLALATLGATLAAPLAASCRGDDDGSTPDGGSPPAIDGAATGSDAAASDPDAVAREAVLAFWDVYHGNDYGAIADTQATLRAALEQNPDSATLHALLGATHFWHVSEAGRDPQPDPAVLSQDLPTAVELFQRAVDLDTGGGHLPGHVNDDHLLGYTGVTTVHLGRAAGDADLVAAGKELLDVAVYQFPEFNNFNLWAAFNDDPRDSETYAEALEALWKGLDACVAATIDRTDPDATPYLHLWTTTGRKKACWTNELAPHGFEGFMYNFGNGLVKANRVDLAAIAYANARLAPGYATWPYRAELEALMASDLAVRAALYADADPDNDPPLNVPGRGCVYCHAEVAEP